MRTTHRQAMIGRDTGMTVRDRHEPTVGAGFARGLLRFAVARGADERSLLAASGIAEALLADHDARVPFSCYIALMRAAKAATGDPALALHFGESVDIAEASVVGLIGQAADTLADALAQLNRYVRLVVEAGTGRAATASSFDAKAPVCG